MHFLVSVALLSCLPVIGTKLVSTLYPLEPTASGILAHICHHLLQLLYICTGGLLLTPRWPATKYTRSFHSGGNSDIRWIFILILKLITMQPNVSPILQFCNQKTYSHIYCLSRWGNLLNSEVLEQLSQFPSENFVIFIFRWSISYSALVMQSASNLFRMSNSQIQTKFVFPTWINM